MRAQLEQIVIDAANRYGIRPQLALAQIRQESGFNPNAKSYANAQGLAQFIPGTWARYGRGSPYDPHAAMDAWGKYMTALLRQFNGREDIALAAYNSGENRAEYRAAAAQGRAINWAVMPAGVQSQTRNYVNSIMSAAGRAGAAISSAAQGASNAVNSASNWASGFVDDTDALGGMAGVLLLGLLVVLVIRR